MANTESIKFTRIEDEDGHPMIEAICPVEGCHHFNWALVNLSRVNGEKAAINRATEYVRTHMNNAHGGV